MYFPRRASARQAANLGHAVGGFREERDRSWSLEGGTRFLFIARHVPAQGNPEIHEWWAFC